MRKYVIGLLLVLCLSACMTWHVTYEGVVTNVFESRSETHIMFDSGAVCIIHKYLDQKLEVGKRYKFTVDAKNIVYEQR